jgi:hypothetical protein
MPENPPKAAPAAPADASAPRETRWSVRRKTEIVIRLLRGESLDALSRETGQLASRLSAWRDEFLAGGEAALKSRAATSSTLTEEQRRDMQAKIGEITMDNELLRAKIAHLEAGLPPALRRSRR